METKLDIDKGKKLACKWGFSFCEGMSSVGTSVGLLLMWDEYVKVEVKSMNNNIISAYVSDLNNNF